VKQSCCARSSALCVSLCVYGACMCVCVCASGLQAEAITWPQFREAMVSWLSPRASGGAGASPKKRTMGTDDSAVSGTRTCPQRAGGRRPAARGALAREPIVAQSPDTCACSQCDSMLPPGGGVHAIVARPPLPGSFRRRPGRRSTPASRRSSPRLGGGTRGLPSTPWPRTCSRTVRQQMCPRAADHGSVGAQ
jgi:hypothetical protein